MTSLVKKSIKRPLLSSREGNCRIGPLALNFFFFSLFSWFFAISQVTPGFNM